MNTDTTTLPTCSVEGVEQLFTRNNIPCSFDTPLIDIPGFVSVVNGSASPGWFAIVAQRPQSTLLSGAALRVEELKVGK